MKNKEKLNELDRIRDMDVKFQGRNKALDEVEKMIIDIPFISKEYNSCQTFILKQLKELKKK